MNDEQLIQLVNDIYDPRIEDCGRDYRQAMTRLYIGLALEEGIRMGKESVRLKVHKV